MKPQRGFVQNEAVVRCTREPNERPTRMHPPNPYLIFFALFPVTLPALTLFFSFLVRSALLVSLPRMPPLSALAFFLSYRSPRTLFFFFCALLINRSGSIALIAFLSPTGNLANA